MRRYTIRSILFSSYAIILVVFFLALSIYSFTSETRRQYDQIARVLGQNTQVTAAAIDNELNQMNTVSMNICYSSHVKQQFDLYLQTNEPAQKGNRVKALIDLLAGVIGPNRTVDQVNLYEMESGMIAAGLDNRHYAAGPQNTIWYQPLAQEGQKRYIAYAGSDPVLGKYSTDPNGKQFVVLARPYMDKLWIPQGYVEVKNSIRRVFRAALDYQSAYGEFLCIFDSSGNQLLGASDSEGLWAALSEAGLPNAMTRIQLGKEVGYALCIPSEMSDFHTVAYIDRAHIFAPLLDYLKVVMGIGLCVLAFALLLAYLAAKHLTNPIQFIYREVASYDLPLAANKRRLKTRIVELAALYEGFEQMQAKIRSGVQQQLTLQEQELQSRMLALQSQMNPHFLYNSLSAIQSMADDGMYEEIIQMCQNMSRILRYISANDNQLVPLKAELECTEGFLQCMILRYQGDLTCQIDMPKELYDVMIPKLCVQQLCENAIKFATQQRPPWHIHIVGKAYEDRYEISIRDSGPGFSADALKALIESIDSINKTGLLPSLSIGGMGLLNIYIRYKLLFKQKMIFSISNHEAGGACVTIGEYYGEKEVPGTDC